MDRQTIQFHWEYVKGVLEHEIPDDATLTKDQHIKSVGFHYQTAMAHGAKHESERSNDAS